MSGHFNNSNDALHSFKTEAPDVVIVGAHLEGTSSIEFLHKVKQMNNSPVVITVSASSHPQYFLRSMKEGADYSIHLPDGIDELIELLERMK